MDLSQYGWWGYLEEDHKNGIKSAYVLLEREKRNPTPGINDFSFAVFPAAKAFEGFLKKLFFDLGFITSAEYEGDHLRIGKALNPSLSDRWREESIYDKLAAFCQGHELPDRLWQVWKSSRNRLFHWWPGHKNVITFEEAQERVNLIIGGIGAAFEECKIKRSG